MLILKPDENTVPFMNVAHWSALVKTLSNSLLDDILTVKISYDNVLYQRGDIDIAPLRVAEPYLVRGTCYYMGDLEQPDALLCTMHDLYLIGSFASYWLDLQKMDNKSWEYVVSLHGRRDAGFTDIGKMYLLYIQRLGQKWKSVS